MESDGSEVDDLADIELSNFALSGQRPSDAHHPDVAGSDSMDGQTDVSNELISPGNEALSGSDQPELRDVRGGESAAVVVDQAESQPIGELGIRTIDSQCDWNAGNSTNPFRKSTSDLLLPTPSPKNPFRDNSPSGSLTSAPNTNPFVSNAPTTPPRRRLQPGNPFLEQSPNNPFRSQSSPVEKKSRLDPFDLPPESNIYGPTEYVYMSRLPGENIGMVLGIDGDQENRRPINAVHVKSITPGGAAARACQGTNRIVVGDEIREIDGKPLNHLTHDECILLLQEMPDNVVLTIYRREDYDPTGNKENDLNPVLLPEVDPSLASDVNETSDQLDGSVFLNTTFQGTIVSVNDLQEATAVEQGSVETVKSALDQIPKGFNAIGVTVYKQESDSLGISIVPSYGATCDLYQIKRLLPGGACSQAQRLELGDRLLACNGRSLKRLGQAQCLQVLKSSGPVVDLTILRPSGKHVPSHSNTDHHSEALSFPSEGEVSVPHDSDLSDSAEIPNLSNKQIQSPSVVDERAVKEDFLSQFHVDTHQGTILEESVGSSESSVFTETETLSDSTKEFPRQVEELTYPRQDNLIHIPPPAEFSDISPKENISTINDVSPKCVTNIDDLLFLNVEKEDSKSIPISQDSFPVNASNELIEFDPLSSEKPASECLDDDLLNLGSKSIEEFAEKCFGQIDAPGPADSKRTSNIEEQPSAAATDQIGSHITIFPVSTQPQKFVSTIPIQTGQRTSDIPTSPPISSTESQPFSTLIQVTSTAADTKVTKIDVNSTPKADVRPTPAPRSGANHPGSVVFHTHVDDNIPVLRSTTISLDGKSKAVAKMNGHQEMNTLLSGAAVTHTTIGVSSKANTGEDEEYIQPMVVSKDYQGKILCVASSQDKTPSSSQTVTTFNSSSLSDLVDSLARNGSHFDAEHKHEDEDDNTATEDEIVATVMSRNDKEIATNVLIKWQSNDGDEKPNSFQKTVTSLIHSQNDTHFSDPFITTGASNHTTDSSLNGAYIGEEEELIVPVTATRDEQGIPSDAPALPKTAPPIMETDKAGLADALFDHLDAPDDPSGQADSHDDDQVDDVSEEAIVPSVLSKSESAMAKTVINSWNKDDGTNDTTSVEKAAVGFMRGANIIPQDGLVHTTLGVSSCAQTGDEEELIQPMCVSKDHQGKTFRLPSAPRSHSPDKEKDTGAFMDIASAMMDYDSRVGSLSKQDTDEEAEGISEETIVPTSLSKDQATVAKSVIENWNKDPETETKAPAVERAAFGFLRGANLVPNGGTTHTTLGVSTNVRSGEEEELIQPMNVAKDHQGKPFRVQASNTEHKPLSEKELNKSAVDEFAKALEFSSVSVSTNGSISSDEEISEETIKPVVMTSAQKQMVSSVIDKWSAIEENPSLLGKAVSRIKVADQPGKPDMLDSKATVKDYSRNGDTPKDQENSTTTSTSDIISQSKSSSGGQKMSFRNAASVFEQTQSQNSETQNADVVLRAKPRPSAGFRARLEGFQKQDSSNAISSSTSSTVRTSRPKSMFELSSSRTSIGTRSSGINSDRSTSFKPLTTIKPLGSSIIQKRTSLSLAEKSGSSLQALSQSRQSPRSDYPKTRQEDGSPFQQDVVLSGIVGLGFKVKVDDGYAVVTDIQKSGPLGKSGNVKVGDFLLSINGKDLTGQTDARVQQVLRLLPRGLVKLVVAGKKPQEADASNLPVETSGDLLSSNNFDDQDAPPPPESAAPVTTASFIASANGIQPVLSHDKSSSITDLSLPIGTSTSESPSNDEQQPPVTARIEISSSNQRGGPMKIAIKPAAPTPRQPPSVYPRPKAMPRFAYASSTNESWDTSSEDSTPRDSSHTVNRKISSIDVIASQRNPAGGGIKEESVVSDSDKSKDSDHEVTATQTSQSHEDSENPIFKPIEDSITKETVENVKSAPKLESSNNSPRKVPPPVAPKPRLSSSSSTKSDDGHEKEPQEGKNTAKISAGYERLQALAKAKPPKPSRVMEKSRTFVTSTAKLFDNKSAEGEDSSAKQGTPSKLDGSRINSSLVPMSQKRQSTGSTPFPSKVFSAQRASSSYSSPLSRPNSLASKGKIPSAVAIPEATSLRDDDSPGAKAVMSPSRINSALSPRRASSVETSSPAVFKFSQRTAPKMDTVHISENKEGKALNSALSPQHGKDKIGVHKITSSSPLSQEFNSRLQSKTESPSLLNEKQSPTTPNYRRKSTSSFESSFSRSSSITSPIDEEKLEDAMKKFDDLLMDTPYSHTETDPSELLLWAPVRKDRSSISNTLRTNKPDSQTTTATTKKEHEKTDAHNLEKESTPEKGAKPKSEQSSTDDENSHVPADLAENKIESDLSDQKFEVSIPDDKLVKEDIITVSTHTEAETAPRIKNTPVTVTCNYESLISKPFENNDNIPALDLAEKISEEMVEECQSEQSLLPQTVPNQLHDHSNSKMEDASDNKYNSERLTEMEDSSQASLRENVENLEKSLLSETVDSNVNQNIPASMLASDINDEEKADPNEQVISFDLDEKETSLAPTHESDVQSLTDANLVSEPNELKQEMYAEHAKQLVDDILVKISQNSDSLLSTEGKEFKDDTGSPASAEDEPPPPLPGAPPPPIIFRTNSALLTEREWLDDNEDTMSSSKIEVSQENIELPQVREESICVQSSPPVLSENTASMEESSENFTATTVTHQNTALSLEKTTEYQISQLSSEPKDFDLNIVGQNTAMAIRQDHSLDEEEGQSRSDSLEPLNSTGDSCHEGFAVRVSSPNSVDVLSEDSGMPADEEFQEVNTDDTISPSELKDFVQIQNSKVSDVSDQSQKPEVLKPSLEPVTAHDSKAFTDTVNNDKENAIDESRSPPPMLPASAPPDYNISSDHSVNSELDITSVPQAQSSDSQPLLKETSSNGEESFVSDKNCALSEDQSISLDEKTPVSEEQSVNTQAVVESSEIVTQEMNSQVQDSFIENDSVDDADSLVEKSDVFSEKKWSFFTNRSEPSLLLSGQPGSTTAVGVTDKELTSVLPISDFVSLIAKANKTMDILKVPQDTEILIVHLHREGDSEPLGIELRLDQQFWYKVSSIVDKSPVAKQGSIANGDFLMAVDNLWCNQCSVMRCMARITKPKHNSVLVLARLNSPLVSTEESSSSKTKDKAAQGERPTVAPRTTHPQVPAVKPRQNKSPTSKTPPPLSPRLKASEEKIPTPVPDTKSQTEPKQETPSTKDNASSASDRSLSQGAGILEVTMMKGATGVGFCLEGGIGSPKGNVPITIKRIFKGGPAEKCGQLKIKDEILEVNGVNFSGMRHYEAWNHLKFLDDGEVILKIRRQE